MKGFEQGNDTIDLKDKFFSHPLDQHPDLRCPLGLSEDSDQTATGCSLCQLGSHLPCPLSFVPTLIPPSPPSSVPGIALPNKILAYNYLPQALLSGESGLRQLASYFPQETGVGRIICLKTLFHRNLGEAGLSED